MNGVTFNGDTYTFDSVESLRGFAATPYPINKQLHANHNSNVLASEKEPGVWFGVGTYEEVEQAFRCGWPDGVNRMLAAMHDIETPAPPTTFKRRKTRGDSGDEYDWQAAAQGENDIAWTRAVQKKIRTARTLTLFCDLAHNSSHRTKADQFFWRGAAILFLADRLSRAGYNVQIIASTRQLLDSPSQQIRQYNVILKQPDMPLDLSTLASSLCLAAFTRVLLFSALCATVDDALSSGLCYAQEAISAPGDYRIQADDLATAREVVQQTLSNPTFEDMK